MSPPSRGRGGFQGVESRLVGFSATLADTSLFIGVVEGNGTSEDAIGEVWGMLQNNSGFGNPWPFNIHLFSCGFLSQIVRHEQLGVALRFPPMLFYHMLDGRPMPPTLA